MFRISIRIVFLYFFYNVVNDSGSGGIKGGLVGDEMTEGGALELGIPGFPTNSSEWTKDTSQTETKRLGLFCLNEQQISPWGLLFLCH